MYYTQQNQIHARNPSVVTHNIHVWRHLWEMCACVPQHHAHWSMYLCVARTVKHMLTVV